jgi:DNA (cytosine-5)-methyltransferase 1
MVVADLYAGIGGWDLAARELGMDPLGIEWDPWACATRRAAGLRTARADAYRLPFKLRPGVVPGLIASPPCQSFSSAGQGAGRKVLGTIADATRAAFAGSDPLDWIELVASKLRDDDKGENPNLYRDAERSLHVAVVARVLGATRPEWVALEQVPEVLPLWRLIRECLRSVGYSAWCGVLNAADFGVPQTRRRAILIASRVRPVHAPEPTHARDPRPSLFGSTRLPWVSMAEALGWGEGFGIDRRQQHSGVPVRIVPSSEPAPTVRATQGSDVRVWIGGNQDRSAVRSIDEPASTVMFGDRANKVGWATIRPATTVAGTPRIAKPGHRHRSAGESQFAECIPITLDEALVLQSFPRGYPCQGPKSAQFRGVGNAIPPLLARAVLRAATGHP